MSLEDFEYDGPLVAVQLRTGPQVVVKGEFHEVHEVLNSASPDSCVYFDGLAGPIGFLRSDAAIWSVAIMDRPKPPSNLVVPEVQMPPMIR
jgi:hypothetical protein